MSAPHHLHGQVVVHLIENVELLGGTHLEEEAHHRSQQDSQGDAGRFEQGRSSGLASCHVID